MRAGRVTAGVGMHWHRNRARFSLLALACLLSVGAVVLSRPRPFHASTPQPAPDAQTETAVYYDLTPDLTTAPPVLRVRMRFTVPGAKEVVRVQMPVWSPGDYNIQNHARYVRDLQAQDEENGRVLEVAHPDANTWEV